MPGAVARGCGSPFPFLPEVSFPAPLKSRIWKPAGIHSVLTPTVFTATVGDSGYRKSKNAGIIIPVSGNQIVPAEFF